MSVNLRAKGPFIVSGHMPCSPSLSQLLRTGAWMLHPSVRPLEGGWCTLVSGPGPPLQPLLTEHLGWLCTSAGVEGCRMLGGSHQPSGWVSCPSVTLHLNILSLGDLVWSCDATMEQCDPGSQFLPLQPTVRGSFSAGVPVTGLGWARPGEEVGAAGVNAALGDQGPGNRVSEWLHINLTRLSLAKPAGTLRPVARD